MSTPVSRRRFLAVSGGAGAAGVVLAACGDDDTGTTSTMTETTSSMADEEALAQFGEGDLGIVNYALTLEYIEAAFYADVIKSGLFKGDNLALIREIGSNEDEHVVALEATAKQLGTPAPRPMTQFPIEGPAQVLELAATVENLGAAAYLGQAPRIQSTQVLDAALSIHSVEGRHAAALNAFDPTLTMDEVLAAVKPFVKS